jgi:hypothetical protein
MTRHSPNTEAERLLALSEKVGRVAESLAELALERDTLERTNPGSESDVGETVDWLIRARRARARYVPAGFFGEPVWDIMLHLLHAEITHQCISESRACLASGLPEGIGRRWLNAMVQNGLVAVGRGPNDGEEQVELIPEVSRSLRRYFRDIVEER